MKNEKIIKLLEKAKKEVNSLTPAGICYPLYQEKLAIKNIDQALILFKQQLPENNA